MFGAPNFHLYVTPGVDLLQVMFTGDVLPASDMNVNPVGGNNKLKGFITALSFDSFACKFLSMLLKKNNDCYYLKS